MDCSRPGSPVHWISQAGVLEWVAISFARDLPYPGIKPVSTVSPVSPALQADSSPAEPSVFLSEVMKMLWNLTREDACTNLCIHYKSLYMCLVVKLCLTLSGLCGLQSTRLLCPWYSPGKNIGVVAISFSRGSFQPRDWTCLSCIGNWVLYHWATREANCMLTRANFMVHEWYPNFLMEFSEKKN